MRKDHDLAEKLRRQGKSYGQISSETGISKSTLSIWFRNKFWADEIKNKLVSQNREIAIKKIKLMAAANKEKWDKKHREWQEEAKNEFPGLKDNPLFLAGLMLYWGEGDKTLKNCVVKLANSDPAMIRLFTLFLQKVLNVPNEKIRANLLLYPDLVDSVQKNFWSKTTGIPMSQFRKSVFIRGRHPTRRLSYGVCNVMVGSRELKEKITVWIDLTHRYFDVIQNNLV